MEDRVRMGVIGAGRIGSLHAEHLASRVPQAELVAIADVRQEAAERCARRHGIPKVYADPAPLLEDADVDAVCICSSTDTHADLIMRAAAAGKQVFCEKPIDLDLARIDEALAAVERAGVKLMVGFNRRFDHNFRRVHQAVQSGAIGTPHILHVISRDPEPPPAAYIKVSGGIFLDMTIHGFDMARYLMDSEVEELYVMGGVRVDPEIGRLGDLDTVVIALRFENGALGTIDNSREAVYGYDQRAEVFGSRGTVRTTNDFPNVATIFDGEGVRRDLPLNFFMERYDEAYVAEMQAFVGCIVEDSEPPTTGADGRTAMLMGYAARRSYEENRPVRLDEEASMA